MSRRQEITLTCYIIIILSIAATVPAEYFRVIVVNVIGFLAGVLFCHCRENQR